MSEPQYIKSETELRQELLKPGYDLLDLIINEATDGLNIVTKNVHYNIAAANFNATIYYKWIWFPIRWFPIRKICDISLYFGREYRPGIVGSMFIHGDDHYQNRIEVTDPPTPGQIKEVRQQIRNLMYTFNLKIPAEED
jgi:hypothetical protein